MNKIFIWAIIIILSGCHARKVFKKEVPEVGKVKIKKRFQTQNSDFQYLNCKSKIEYTNGLENFTSNANIRISKDSVIWVSINPALGIEVVRCLINKDSLFIINKIQKEYYIFSFQELSRKLNFDLNYNLIQSTLFGNLPFVETENDSNTTTSDSLYTILHQSRKNVTVENFVNNGTLKLEKMALKDVNTGNSVDINYENFTKVENILFAFINKIALNYRNKKGFQNIYIGIEHHKLEPSDKSLKFPFSISSKYERKGTE